MYFFFFLYIIISFTFDPARRVYKARKDTSGRSTLVEGTVIGSGLKRVGAFGGVFILTVTVTTD